MNENLTTNEVLDDVVEVCEMPAEVGGNNIAAKVIIVAGVAVAAVVGTVLYKRHKNKNANEEVKAERKRKFHMFNLKDDTEICDEDSEFEDEE